MADIFDEVEEDVRRDRALELWKKYGNYVVGAAVLVVAATAGFTGWRDWDRRQAEAETARFLAATQLAVQGDSSGAASAFAAIVRDGRAGYALLARFHEAALKAKSDDAAGAAAMYRAIAAANAADLDMRNVARLLAALHSVETSDAAAIERELAPLAGSDHPWRHLALEITAIAAARAGDVAKARELYTKIADDPAAPSGLRARAAEMIAALSG
ncbi:MAG: tetratricopeptide repeat protein [Proteobacteria bacterium]|nr:tetratricopeptide repeat protein [Pseudomonadota bacterium]